MKHAIVAIEDRRFYEHQGVDLRGIVRAAWQDVSNKELVQGGSTITQQFVKNALVEDDRTVSRKVKEAALAWQLERQWNDKDRIVTAYLNTIYFGNGAYGVQQAALTYFGHGASELGLAEAALLAAIPADPSRYDPLTHPRNARARRNLVLRYLFEQGKINRRDLLVTSAAPLPRREDVRPPAVETIVAPYFANYVKEELIDRFDARCVYGGGLRVTTTIDLQLQRIARRAIAKWLDDELGPTAALVALDPRDGSILAMVGGRNFRESQFNLAVAGRAPAGLVLQAVRARGRAPGRDRPRLDVRLEAEADLARRQALVGPQLRERLPRGSHPRRGDDALRQRRLRGADAARRDRRRSRPPRAGSGSSASSTPTSRSVSAPRRSTRSSSPAPTQPSRPAASGSTARSSATGRASPGASRAAASPRARGPLRPARVLRRATATSINQMLQDVVRRGTGRRAALADRPVAGKTGTTENYGDAWFVATCRSS